MVVQSLVTGAGWNVSPKMAVNNYSLLLRSSSRLFTATTRFDNGGSMPSRGEGGASFTSVVSKVAGDGRNRQEKML